MESEETKLPALPPLSSLSLTDSNLNSFDSSSVWATTTSLNKSTVENVATMSNNNGVNSDVSNSSSTSNQKGFNIADLNEFDPYAPSPFANSNSLGLGSTKPIPPPLERISTLGSSVLPHSMLELIDSDADADASSSAEHSPTTSTTSPPLPPNKETLIPPFTPPKINRVLSGSESSGIFSIFGRSSLSGGSTSSSNTVKPDVKSPAGAEEEKAGLRQDYSEKHQRTPSDSLNPTPIASTSSISNPLTTFASAFRSATSSRASSQAGTPPPRPQTSNLDSGNKNKESSRGKEKVVEKEKGNDNQETEVEFEATFDFNKFLEQMRLRSADPIAKYLRS